ncbi:DNA topoisomerase IV subunit B [Akkermansia glycaniphila]|uniref:DNA topoisomerase (ATP-hydrolyzing) n=1 Tax=Akkermansia glycaniphila TaxID=1679444 RepID=A0A1C7PE08_9BACT|nr:DNA topoisomerase IV subunit B [Akkermansia glycaniphila]OCA03619.1 DNA topoisomerase IV [Akkermansia glycaniphila]SEH79536.1 dna topoisomerase type iia [Akkermansia glycaniphila]
MEVGYSEKDIQTLDWREHIRLRQGMYIGKLGDGSMPDDGMYVLLKEVIDNAIDEYVMGYGQRILITLQPDGHCEVRDFGRGIPLGSLYDCAAKINTGGKYEGEAFTKSVGLNGVGIKAVNALSSHFEIQAYRDGSTRRIQFSEGIEIPGSDLTETTEEPNGTRVAFRIDTTIFPENATFRKDYIARMCRYYCYLNTGLAINFNGQRFISKNGLLDLLREEMGDEALYEPIHITGQDIEIAITHGTQYGEEYYSFVNGQHTTQGGTHQSAFREAIAKTLRDFYKKPYDASDIRSSIVAAISIKVVDPIFESQTKTKLGSNTIAPGSETIRTFIGNFLAKELDNYLHRHPDAAKAIEDKIKEAEKARKEIAGIQKNSRERAKKAKVHNKKLRDCRVHYDTKHKRAAETMIFITEGDSASGSITTARDAETQAVFSLKGKPANSFGVSRTALFEEKKNEELDLLHLALNIDKGLEDLRYNHIVIATDADVDGMHIRILLLTFFIQYFPELIREGHLYILQTPLFRVRNKQQTIYCYSDTEREKAISKLGKNPEITRFKGLGEISPSEFKHFIGPDIRLERVTLENAHNLKEIIAFYMGDNTEIRKQYIIDNLRIELDPA